MSIGIFITSILAIAGTTILLVAIHLWRERNRGLFSPFTEDMLRPPGYSLRNKIDDLWIDFYASFTAIVIIAVFWFNSVVHSKSFLAALLPSVVYVIALFYLFRRTLNQLETLQNYRLGLSGEEYVGQELNRLMLKGARVFHDFDYEYKRGNIDHLIVAPGGIIVVETKAYRKPQKHSGADSALAKVEYDGSSLKFPRFTSKKPVDQASSHAKHISSLVREQCDADFPVTAVVCLPGWFVQPKPSQQTYSVKVINPKGNGIEYFSPMVNSENPHPQFAKVLSHIEGLARSVPLQKKPTDANAAKHFDFWLRPKSE